MKPALVQALAHPRVPLAAAGLGVLLLLTTLGGGLGADDYLQRSRLLAEPAIYPVRGVLLDLFSFFPGAGQGNEVLAASGYLPWWADPDVRIVFFRPLSALTHLLDYRLWPDLLPAHHAQSLLWYGLGVWLVAHLYRQLLGPGATAGLAALLFAAEDAHATPVGWLANRNALIALVFGALAVQAHLRWRAAARGGGGWLAAALAATATGLLAGEATLGPLAYVVAWEVCAPPLADATGTPRPRPSLPGRILALLPYGALVVAWRTAYGALGFGVHGSGLYTDPGSDPVGFLLACLERGPVMLLAQWTQAPIDAWVILTREGQLGLTAAGIVATALVGVLVAPVVRARPLARFFVVGSLLALLPTCAAFPMDRQLVSVGIGALGLLALLADHHGFFQVRPEDRRAVPRWLTAKLLVFLHAGVVLVYTPFRAANIPHVFSVFSHIAEEAPRDAALADQALVFVNGIDLLTMCVPMGRFAEGPVPRRIALLTSLLDGATVERPDDRTLVVSPDGGFLENPTDRFARSLARPFTVGETIVREDFTATVDALGPHGRPTRVTFRFTEPLETPHLRWVWWKDRALQPYPLPPVGSTTRVERSLPGLAP